MTATHKLLLCLIVPSLTVGAFQPERIASQASCRRKILSLQPFITTARRSLIHNDLPLRHANQHSRLSMSRTEDKEEDEDESPILRTNSEQLKEPNLLRQSNPQHHNITEASIDRTLRVSKAKAEIDRILQGPDAPFDAESELKKVVSIAPPVQAELAEQELEAKVSQLEQDLYRAVKQQDYAQAAATKQEISQLHIDDCGAVLQVNAAFYRAFSNKDLPAMERLWLLDGTSSCIHPSHRPLIGSKAVLEGWKRMFASSDGSFQRNWMEPSDIRVAVKGASTAIVTCDEYVYARQFIRGQKRQTELLNKLTATNLFRKVAGKWYLCHHHASWHADSEAAKQALRRSLPSSGNQQGNRILMGGNNKGDNGNGDENLRMGMDGILGMNNFGPLLGGSENNAGKKPIKKIIMGGDLSDILNGSLGDILGSGDDSSADDNNSSNQEGNAIISFHRVEESGEDDGEEEEMDAVVDHDDESEDGDETRISVFKQLSRASDSGSDSSSSNAKADSDASSPTAPKDVLRQSCISALRKLCVQGSISAKQKRVLLTDIITCSAKGEFSMVEVAYELLCGEGEDKEAAEEEFADQCRVFALSLPDSTAAPAEQ